MFDLIEQEEGGIQLPVEQVEMQMVMAMVLKGGYISQFQLL